MFMLTPLQETTVIAFLVTVMTSIGLQVTLADLHRELSRPGLLLRTVLANFVIVPVVGVLLARLLVPDPPVAAAFVLLACTPGGISALQFTSKARGAGAYSGVTACLLSLLAVFVSPMLVGLAMPGEVKVAMPYAGAIGFLLVFLVLPVAGGMFIKARAERMAALLARVLGLSSVVLFAAAVVMPMAMRKGAIRQVGGRAAGLLLVLVLLSMVAGWLLGGPGTATRQVLASATGMRHVALALAMVACTFPDPTAMLPALAAFSALMVPPSLLLTVGCMVVDRRRGQTGEAAPGAGATGTQRVP